MAEDANPEFYSTADGRDNLLQGLQAWVTQFPVAATPTDTPAPNPASAPPSGPPGPISLKGVIADLAAGGTSVAKYRAPVTPSALAAAFAAFAASAAAKQLPAKVQAALAPYFHTCMDATADATAGSSVREQDCAEETLFALRAAETGDPAATAFAWDILSYVVDQVFTTPSGVEYLLGTLVND